MAPVHSDITTYAGESMPPGRLVSFSLRCSGITARDVLRHARGHERFYWQDNRGLALAGFGIAAEVSAWGEDRFKAVQAKLGALFEDPVLLGEGGSDAHPLIGPRVFGGFAFQPDFVPDNTWSIYAPAWFILPHYQFTQAGDEAWLTINAHVQYGDNEPDALRTEDLREALQTALQARCQALRQIAGEPFSADEQPQPLRVHYPMTYATWTDKITDAIGRIRAGEMQKVVLSRVCEIRFSDHVDIDRAFHYLHERYADCHHFLFEPRPYHAFYGATPELLAQVEGDSVRTMGLAGSVRRGPTPQEDEALARQLLGDPKERLEHALVVQAVCEKLGAITAELNAPETPGIYRLSNIQHLYTPIQGRLRRPLGVLPVVELLHPTPALGGSPCDVAMAFIRDAEPVPRGWYAGPVGWVNHRLDGAFGVAIRSAVTQDRRVWMYAGAGIVGDSVPQKEWDETALKFRPMLDALGIQATSSSKG